MRYTYQVHTEVSSLERRSRDHGSHWQQARGTGPAMSMSGPIGPAQNVRSCPLTVTPRPDRDALEVTLQLASVIVVKMSTDPLSIYWPPGSSDFVDISDVFLDAAEGMSLLRVKLIDIVMIYA
jgi:hypothetical protein